MTTDQQTTLTSLLQRIQTALKAATTAIEDGDDPANLPGEVSEAFYHLIEELEELKFNLSVGEPDVTSLLVQYTDLGHQLSRMVSPESSDTYRNSEPERPRP